MIKLNLQTRVITSIGEIRFENKFDVSHMSYQKPRLRPRLTGFSTQSLSREPCKAIPTAQAGSAFLGSASAGLRLRAEPCTSLVGAFLRLKEICVRNKTVKRWASKEVWTTGECTTALLRPREQVVVFLTTVTCLAF